MKRIPLDLQQKSAITLIADHLLPPCTQGDVEMAAEVLKFLNKLDRFLRSLEIRGVTLTRTTFDNLINNVALDYRAEAKTPIELRFYVDCDWGFDARTQRFWREFTIAFPVNIVIRIEYETTNKIDDVAYFIEVKD